MKFNKTLIVIILFSNSFLASPSGKPEGFGFKEMTYQYGDSSQIAKLMPLRDRLLVDGVECDIELGASLNSYGSVQTIVTDIKIPQMVAKA